MRHWHIDILDSRMVPLWSSGRIYSKGAARREFSRIVEELGRQVGKFVVRRPSEEERATALPGAVRIAKNHRLVVVLSGCDCDGGE